MITQLDEIEYAATRAEWRLPDVKAAIRRLEGYSEEDRAHRTTKAGNWPPTSIYIGSKLRPGYRGDHEVEIHAALEALRTLRDLYTVDLMDLSS